MQDHVAETFLLADLVLELGIFSAASHPKGWARILPSCLDHISSDSTNAGTGCDGFFVARLQPVRS